MNSTDNGAVIVEAVRTPVGRGHPEKGIYRDVHPADLLGRAYEGVIARAGIDANEVDNVIVGCAHQVAEQSTGIARTAWLQKGLPESTGATTVDIRCGSGQQAVHFAALRIQAGADDVVTNEDGSIEVLAAPSEFEAVQKALEAANLKPDGAEVTMRPESHVELAGDDSARMQKLLDIIEDLDQALTQACSRPRLAAAE